MINLISKKSFIIFKLKYHATNKSLNLQHTLILSKYQQKINLL
jgi:hypothetical protein